jgi:predicted outer membrane repeat protein
MTPTRPSFRPRLEALEDRCVLSTLTVKNMNDHGGGSLRGAIAAAQSGDTIVFSPKLAGQTITLTTGELDITKNLTIQGLGAGQLTISGDNLSRVFEVAPSIAVSLSGLTIGNGDGNASADVPDPSGGHGGGILNRGALTVSGCTVSNNSAGNGGGVYNAGGTLTVSGCTLSNNSAGNGGGVYNGAMMTITGCTLSGNSAANNGLPESGFGGGVYNIGTLTVSGCTVTRNSATYFGGGIYNETTLTVLDSIFSSNSPDNISNSPDGSYTDGGGNTFS